MLIFKFWLCSFFNQNSPSRLALYETNLEDSIDSCNFFVPCYFPFFPKGFASHMHVLETSDDS